MCETLIDANNLALVRGERCLFKSLNFHLGCGQAIHVTGKNGSGKTSLFKVLTGTLPPTAGTLKIFGKPLPAFEKGDFQQRLYLGHQSAIKPHLTVAENVMLNAELFDILQVDECHLKRALVAVGLWNFREQAAGKLSAGQKRRIALARLWGALSNGKSHKKLWLLDEPLTALDMDFIDTLQHHIATHLDCGGGVIFTSHQPLRLGREIMTLALADFQ